MEKEEEEEGLTGAPRSPSLDYLPPSPCGRASPAPSVASRPPTLVAGEAG